MKIPKAQLLLLLLVLSSGCSPHTPGPRMEEETPERRMFKSISAFYCEKGRWPDSLLELKEAGRGSQGSDALDVETLSYFDGATVVIPRPILYSLEYTFKGGTDPQVTSRRRATFIAPPLCGDENLPEGGISLAGGRVRCVLPPGYLPLTLAQIRERWGSGPAPDVAWSDSSGSITVAVRFGEAQLTLQKMESFKAGVESAYARSVPGIQWHRREIALQSEPPLLLHEFTSTSSRGLLRTVAFSLSFDSSLLSITITGPESSAEAVGTVSTLLRDSLKVK